MKTMVNITKIGAIIINGLMIFLMHTCTLIGSSRLGPPTSVSGFILFALCLVLHYVYIITAGYNSYKSEYNNIDILPCWCVNY